MRLLRSFQYPTPIRLGLYRLAPVGLCRNDVPVYAVGCRVRGERDTARRLRAQSDSDTVASVQVVFSDEKEGHMDADDCARIVEGVAAVLDLLATGGDAVDDPAPIYELLAERCRHVRVALEVMTGCE